MVIAAEAGRWGSTSMYKHSVTELCLISGCLISCCTDVWFCAHGHDVMWLKIL